MARAPTVSKAARLLVVVLAPQPIPKEDGDRVGFDTETCDFEDVDPAARASLQLASIETLQPMCANEGVHL